MRIEEMYRNYLERRDATYLILKKSVKELVLSFEDVVDKIPEDEIYQALAFNAEYYWREDDCLEYIGGHINMKNDKMVYNLGFDDKEIQMEQTITMVREFMEFIYSKYQRRILFNDFRWAITNPSVVLKFEIPLNKKETENKVSYKPGGIDELWEILDMDARLLFKELERALSNMKVTVEQDWRDDTKLIICLACNL